MYNKIVMNVYVLDIAPLRGREREALALLPEERREKALHQGAPG